MENILHAEKSKSKYFGLSLGTFKGFINEKRH